MATVLLSTLYPAFQASRMSQPDDRRWELAEPDGDIVAHSIPVHGFGFAALGRRAIP